MILWYHTIKSIRGYRCGAIKVIFTQELPTLPTDYPRYPRRYEILWHDMRSYENPIKFPVFSVFYEDLWEDMRSYAKLLIYPDNETVSWIRLNALRPRGCRAFFINRANIQFFQLSKLNTYIFNTYIFNTWNFIILNV